MLRFLTPAIIFGALWVATPGLSQKAKDKKVDIKYVSLPAEKLPENFTTYSVTVYGGNIAIAGFTTGTLEDRIRLDGFKRVGTTNVNEFGHLRISVNTGTVNTGRLAWKTRSESYKNDKGVVVKTNYYWYELPCSGITSFKVVDPEGEILSSGSRTYNSSEKSAETTSSSTLSKQAESLAVSLRKQYASDMAETAVSEARNTVRSKYDFAFATDDPQFYTIKKHPEEDAFDANLEKTISVFKALPANAPSEEGMKQMESCIKFWSKFSETAPGKDKDLQEVYSACNANLAYTYFYLDQFDKAEMHAKRILAVDPKEKRVERFLESMEKTKQRMDKLDIHTMHYSRDLANALPPSKVKEMEEAKEQMQADNNSLPGFLVTGTDTIQGLFMRSKSEEDFIFGPNGNTKFMVEKSGALEEQDVTKAEVNGFAIGERKFMRMMFSPCAKGKSEPSLNFLEQLYDSDKIKLYKYYPISGTLSHVQPEYAFQKTGESAPISLLDTQFLLWDKGLANYFSDCADLKDLCSQGGFKMNEDDLLKAARVYAEVCE